MFINNIYGGIMSGRRYALREDQWEKIKDLVPGREGLSGATGKDNRLFIEAVIYRYRSGIPWRDLPERFGDWNNIARRHKRWSDKGVWQKIFEQLSIESDDEYAAIDSTIVRVHQDASGAKKGVKNLNV
jgi:transposase